MSLCMLPCAKAQILSLCAFDQSTGQRLCKQMEFLLKHPWAMVSRRSVAVASPAVCISRGVTNYSCKAITQGSTRAVYLSMGLCHCHSNSHSDYLLIFHSPKAYVPRTPPPHSPCILMNPFSHFISISEASQPIHHSVGNKGQCG